MRFDALSRDVIGAAIKVHSALGPGLLESAYEACLVHELSKRGIPFERQVPLRVFYDGLWLDCAYRMDIVVADQLVLELKAIASLLPVHEAQLLSYLRLSGIPLGILFNFHAMRLNEGGMARVVNNYRPSHRRSSPIAGVGRGHH